MPMVFRCAMCNAILGTFEFEDCHHEDCLLDFFMKSVDEKCSKCGKKIEKKNWKVKEILPSEELRQEDTNSYNKLSKANESWSKLIKQIKCLMPGKRY